MDTPTAISPIRPLTDSQVIKLDRQEARRAVWREFGTIGFDAYVQWVLTAGGAAGVELDG